MEGPAPFDLERLGERLARVPTEAAAEPETRAAVAMVLDRASPDLDVLLMRRVVRAGDRWSGQISLPGGHRSAEDEDLAATAIRETLEEAGIDLRRAGRLLGRLPAVRARARGGFLPLWIAPFVFACPTRAPTRAGPEAEEVFWFPLRRAAAGELDERVPYPGNPTAPPLAAWRWEGRVVWGLTYLMLGSLLGRLRVR